MRYEAKRCEKRGDMRARLEKAKKLVAAGDLENAKALYSHMMRFEPKCVEAYLGLADVKVLDRGGKGFEEASSLIRDAIAIAPHFDQSYIELARVYEQAQSLDKALSILKDALTPCPMSYKLHYHLGRVLHKRGRTAQAIQELEKAIKIRPDFEDAGELLKLVVHSK